MQNEFVLLLRRECPVPIGMRFIGRQQRAFQEALELIFEADFVVGDRPVSEQTEQAAANRACNTLCASGIPVRRIGDVTAKQFVGTLAAQGNRYMFTAKRRKKPDGESPRVSKWLV
jgi:hypothetical protein